MEKSNNGIQIINLVNQSAGTLTYSIYSRNKTNEKIVALDAALDPRLHYIVISAIRNPTDLFMLQQVAQILNKEEALWELYIPFSIYSDLSGSPIKNGSNPSRIIIDTLNDLNPISIKMLEVPSEHWQVGLSSKLRCLPAYDIFKKIDNSDYITNGENPEDLHLYLDEKGEWEILNKEDFNSLFEKKDRPILIRFPAQIDSKLVEKLRELFSGFQLSILITHITDIENLKEVCNIVDKVFVSNSTGIVDQLNKDEVPNNLCVFDVLSIG